MKKACAEVGCDYVCADVTNYANVQNAVEEASLKNGKVNIMVCCAGASWPGYFLDQDVEVFQKSINLNYMGCVHCAKAVAQGMCERGDGHIVFVSSAVAAASFMGYSTYAPGKFAVRGLADAIRNELCGFGVRVSIAYPPDTDTPGFARENETKPKECLDISPPSVYTSDQVAAPLYDDLLWGKYHLDSPDIVQNLLIAGVSGITPRGRLAPIHYALSPLISFVMNAFGWNADRIAAGYGKRMRKEWEKNK